MRRVATRRGIMLICLLALSWPMALRADNSSFRCGEATVKGGTLTLPLMVCQAQTATIVFNGFAERPSSLAAKQVMAKQHVELGRLEIPAGASEQRVKIGLDRLKQELGIGPGDTLHVAAHWVDVGHVWGNQSSSHSKFDGTTIIVPGTAAKNACFTAARSGAWRRLPLVQRWPARAPQKMARTASGWRSSTTTAMPPTTARERKSRHGMLLQGPML